MSKRTPNGIHLIFQVLKRRYSTASSRWNDTINRKYFIEDLGDKLKIRKPEDWYEVTEQRVQQIKDKDLYVSYPTL
jgi:hypothetical protein